LLLLLEDASVDTFSHTTTNHIIECCSQSAFYYCTYLSAWWFGRGKWISNCRLTRGNPGSNTWRVRYNKSVSPLHCFGRSFTASSFCTS